MTRILAALALALSLLAPSLALGQGADLGTSATSGAAPSSLRPGQVVVNRADRVLYYSRSDGTVGAAPLDGGASFRNRVTNGAFTINQRAVTGTVTLAAGAYGHDRWKAGTGGATYTFSTAANGDVTLTITAGTLLQIITADMVHAGGSYRLSWSGTAQGRVHQGTPGAYAAGPITATLSAGINTTVEFGTGTLSLVQLEPGTVVTAFERRGDEQQRCDRFLQFHSLTARWTSFAASQSMEVHVTHRVPMRAIPTPTLVAAGGRSNVSGVSVIAFDQYSSRFQINSSSGADTYAIGDKWLLSAEP
ncbi:hypothetical protein [Methylobacterium sp. WSM2598]|uniref:hypothetical protein n=1 Tax=Methylobacterium sp. WSM2598 TaxID=398261 RepID=UPI00037005D0|nr:hypothetical protein [Methylobacterium sp. WSM2598]